MGAELVGTSKKVDQVQSKQQIEFERTAKLIDCDESEDALDRAMDGLKVKVEPEEESTDEK